VCHAAAGSGKRHGQPVERQIGFVCGDHQRGEQADAIVAAAGFDRLPVVDTHHCIAHRQFLVAIALLRLLHHSANAKQETRIY
jgi:hypothetical protein